jgi:SET domain-containing protein
LTRVVVRRARNGKGLFAARSYRTGETIIRINGRIVHHEVVWDRGGRFADNCFRFGPETYLDPGDDFGAYLNHSCEPNAGIVKRVNQLFLIAASEVPRGRELVIDYSTILGADDIWTMPCNCGRRSCRRRVRNVASLSTGLRDEYVARGLIPRYIIGTLR